MWPKVLELPTCADLTVSQPTWGLLCGDTPRSVMFLPRKANSWVLLLHVGNQHAGQRRHCSTVMLMSIVAESDRRKCNTPTVRTRPLSSASSSARFRFCTLCFEQADASSESRAIQGAFGRRFRLPKSSFLMQSVNKRNILRSASLPRDCCGSSLTKLKCRRRFYWNAAIRVLDALRGARHCLTSYLLRWSIGL